VLVVTKLDRLGRNAMDVRATVDRLGVAGSPAIFVGVRLAETQTSGDEGVRVAAPRLF
jgi:hypothetical protein